LLLGSESAAASKPKKNQNSLRKADMPRVRKGPARHLAKKRILKAVKGYQQPSTLELTANAEKETSEVSGLYASAQRVDSET
jgi:hypothetical protein